VIILSLIKAVREVLAEAAALRRELLKRYPLAAYES
jgi:hypothetical protein